VSAQPLRLVTVDLAAVRENIHTLGRLVDGAHVMAVVKANGYGHGAVPVAEAALAAGATYLGVADVTEALELRAAGITAPILAWLHSAEANFDAAYDAGIELGLSSIEQLQSLTRSLARNEKMIRVDSRPAIVQLKIDTGLGRNGAFESEWDALFTLAARREGEGLIEVRGIFSHLSNTSDEEDIAQLTRFNRAVTMAREAGLQPTLRHLASTAAAIRLPGTRLDMVRIGIGMYGLSPFFTESSADLGLRPAMTLESRVIAVKRVPAGTGVSYGYSYRTQQASTLALVALGYADGIPRRGSNGAPVWIRGKTYQVAGRIAMDQLVVDLGTDSAEVGDRAVLFGDPEEGYPAADDWAVSADTINYEIVTRLGGRFQRRYVS
jgi:alanine racemase